jgi:AcrR family transcriptional regulator
MRALDSKTPRARLRASGLCYVRFALENPHDYRVIFMTSAKQTTSAPPLGTAPTFQFLVDRVRECIEAGDLADGDARELAATIWSHVHGLASLRLSGHLAEAGNDEAFVKFFQRSTDQLLRGLAP